MTETRPARNPPDTAATPDQPEVVEILRRLIRFDTTNWGRGRSHGERDAAQWIAGQLEAVGWAPQVLAREDARARANVVLRVAGSDPSLPALLVHGHLDVVPAEGVDWTVDPFFGEVRDGWVWGRGAVDMKDMCATILATLLRWGRTGERPRRDVVVAFVADEEDGGAYGAQWLVDAHPELFAGVEAGISESGGAFRWLEHGSTRVRCFPVAAAERGSLHIRLTAHGVAGHGSRPVPGMAVTRLVDALHRLAHHPWPVHLSPVVRAQLSTTSAALGLAVDLDSDAGVEACVAALGEAADVARWTVRASTTPTMLDAGYKVNVVPGVATAEVDVRCPPGFEDALQATLPTLIGDEVDWEYTAHSLPVSAPVDGPWFAAITAAVHEADPAAVVVPYCMGGGTDAKAFAQLGIAGYGFAPLGEDPGGLTPQGMHGVDERVPVASLLWGADVLHAFLTRT